MRFRIDLKIFIFLALFYITRQIEIYATIMIFCIIHEFGHLLAGFCLKMTPSKLEIMPFGVSVSFKLKTKDYNKKILNANLLELKKIIIAIAGPLTNLVLIIYFILFDTNILSRDVVIYANILIMAFNLLPIYPLDGGRILKSVVHIIWNGKASKEITNKVANITVILLTVISSIGIFYYENIAILLIILFLWYLIARENRKYRFIMQAYNEKNMLEKIKQN